MQELVQLEFLAEAFRCHVHNFQCLTVPVVFLDKRTTRRRNLKLRNVELIDLGVQAMDLLLNFNLIQFHEFLITFLRLNIMQYILLLRTNLISDISHSGF